MPIAPSLPARCLVALASIVLVTVVAGCGADEAPSEPPSPEEAPVATDPAEPDPSPAADVEEARQVPDSCASIGIELGGTIDGSALGPCAYDAHTSYGSGTEYVFGGELEGEARYTYEPGRFEFQGEFSSSTGPVTMTLVDDTMWIDNGAGPIRSDPDSQDPMAQVLAGAAEMYRFLADPSVTADLFAASPVWNVDAELALKTLENGEDVEAYRITSAEPFEWHGISISDYIVWFSEDWTPVGEQSTAEIAGVVATSGKDFYRMGEPVEITPPGEEVPDDTVDTSADAFPSCDEIAEAAGIADLPLIDEDAQDQDGRMHGLICGWATDPTIDFEPVDLLDGETVNETGVLVMTLTDDPDPITADMAEASGFLLSDPRAERIGGFVFASPATELAGPVGAVGVDVIVGNLSVAWGSMSWGAGTPEQLAPYTNDWAIDAGVAVHTLL